MSHLVFANIGVFLGFPTRFVLPSISFGFRCKPTRVFVFSWQIKLYVVIFEPLSVWEVKRHRCQIQNENLLKDLEPVFHAIGCDFVWFPCVIPSRCCELMSYWILFHLCTNLSFFQEHFMRFSGTLLIEVLSNSGLVFVPDVSWISSLHCLGFRGIFVSVFDQNWSRISSQTWLGFQAKRVSVFQWIVSRFWQKNCLGFLEKPVSDFEQRDAGGAKLWFGFRDSRKRASLTICLLCLDFGSKIGLGFRDQFLRLETNADWNPRQVWREIRDTVGSKSETGLVWNPRQVSVEIRDRFGSKSETNLDWNLMHFWEESWNRFGEKTSDV